MMSTEPARPPADKIAWMVWRKADPSVFVEVSEQFWVDARVLGACRISERTGAAVFFDELEAVPVDGSLVNLEVERMRRSAQREPAIR